MQPRRAWPFVLLGLLVIAASGAGTVAYLIETGELAAEPPWPTVAALAAVLVPAALGTIVVLVVFVIAERTMARRGHPARTRALRSLRGLAILVVLAVAVAGGAGGLGSALLSVGLVGFGLTLALQRPILSLGAWASIRFGRMFQEGDRIQVGSIEGDVLDIRLFTTQLWEVGETGSRTPGRPTGRIRTVSNAVFLEQSVANATSDTPTIFDEFGVTVAYEADLALARAILKEVAAKVVDPEAHKAAAHEYRRRTQGMPMERHFPSEPVVTMHLEEDWIELRLRYLVDARRRGFVRSSLAEEWQTRVAEHGERLPNVYRRTQVQQVGPDGRPVLPAGAAPGKA